MQQVSWHDSMTARRFTQPTVSRRQMLGMTGLGFGSLALTGVMHEDGRGADVRNLSVGLDPRSQHFPGPARAVIQLMMTGGPSQMDLFDPKPVLQQRDGEVFETRIDAFQEGSEPNRLLGSPFRFRKHGECGMDLSELMPHLATVVDDIRTVRLGEQSNPVADQHLIEDVNQVIVTFSADMSVAGGASGANSVLNHLQTPFNWRIAKIVP